ncbi:hypothetical protein ABPG72_022595 [Tetrahymena utriculariae]
MEEVALLQQIQQAYLQLHPNSLLRNKLQEIYNYRLYFSISWFKYICSLKLKYVKDQVVIILVAVIFGKFDNKVTDDKLAAIIIMAVMTFLISLVLLIDIQSDKSFVAPLQKSEYFQFTNYYLRYVKYLNRGKGGFNL